MRPTLETMAIEAAFEQEIARIEGMRADLLASRMHTADAQVTKDYGIVDGLKRGLELIHQLAPPMRDSVAKSDPCPDCGAQLYCAAGGGVKCPTLNCGYWFCF